MGAIRLILGDQLTHDISSLTDINIVEDTILMCEVWDEATYVKHHKKKIAFIFSAMRHFADELRGKGYQVIYTRLDDPGNTGSFWGEMKRYADQLNPEKIVVTFPGEYRVHQEILSWAEKIDIPVELRQDDRFLCSIDDFHSWAEGKKSLRMEFFYREMRRKYSILMDGVDPEGGQWNYDHENRQAYDRGSLFIPQPYVSKIDDVTQEVIELVDRRFPDHFGDLLPFYFAVTHAEALKVLECFIDARLPLFGTYQDAMVEGQPWMYHSHISFYLNCGLLTAYDVVRKVEQAYYQGKAPLNAVEGFIRQIIGWREYVRGIYWMQMPSYAMKNELGASRALPWFFWSGETKMNCLRQCITETKKHAYAHHIQRLMVLGNFALMAGVDPKYVNEWFLVVYADAYEWVELPNVSGMILYADGGYLASKPYASSGAYINKMSDYCKNCHYKVEQKSGDTACPFNYLYWNFMIEHRDQLKNNHRMAMMYKTLEKMSDEKIEMIQRDSLVFLSEIGIN